MFEGLEAEVAETEHEEPIEEGGGLGVFCCVGIDGDVGLVLPEVGDHFEVLRWGFQGVGEQFE